MAGTKEVIYIRMWLIEPKTLCKSHILGEHRETHTLAGAILKGRSIKGYLEKKQVEPRKLVSRHDELAKEMLARGSKHNSPLELNTAFFQFEAVEIDVKANLQDLHKRCKGCKKRHKEMV